MAGQYNGLQAKLKEHCTYALFVSCLVHSLNLFLQKLYTFFASSTHRWNVLKECLGPGIVVKRLSDTRWSARADAVSALQKSYPSIIEALRTMDDQHELPETRNEARGILKKMQMLDTFEMYETTSKQNYPDFEYKTNTTRSRQRSSRLTFFDGATEDTQFQDREKFRTEVYIPIIDTLIAQLQQRSKAYDQLLNLFGFFSRLSVLRTEELEIHCQTFTEFYHFKHYLFQEKMRGDHIPIYDMYNLLKSNNLVETFPNVEIAFRIFLSLMVTKASGERSFSKLKLIKNELRNSMCHERLKCLSLMSFENDLLQEIDFNDVIEDFALQKSRRKPV
ncbi:hypothetical protein RN001_016149 [Aquatica leii]|uniref:HAT C-terminal dimerisation domain-containing protein n=1 Tax=Aquatica leii TaxID=1421715 RepID=A0AAN7SN16_9COLE|nr:hypothetical protein RN001_016149 [Aquatica leii]